MPQNTKKSTAPIYGGRFRVLSGGSRWKRALPAVSLAWHYHRVFRIRRNRPLQSMAVDFVCCCAAAGGSGHCPVVCCPAAAGGAGSACRFPCVALSQGLQNTKKSTALIYGGRFRVLSGGSRWPSALPTRILRCRSCAGRAKHPGCWRCRSGTSPCARSPCRSRSA